MVEKFTYKDEQKLSVRMDEKASSKQIHLGMSQYTNISQTITSLKYPSFHRKY